MFASISGRIAALALAAAALLPGSAPAAVLLQVGGADQALTIRAGEAAAVSFMLGAPAANLSISAPLLCLGCRGAVWLHRDEIGPRASFGDAVEAHAFTSSGPRPFFSISRLDPGLYFLILSIDPDSPGSAIWSGASTPSLTIHSEGASRGLDFTASTASAFAPLSNFSVAFGHNLNFTVTAASVPEPGTWALMSAAFGLIGFVLRRRQPRLPPRRLLATARPPGSSHP